MQINYKKLWKLLIELDMNKRDLSSATGLSSSTIAKLGKNENVNTDTLVRICDSLSCGIEDIVEIK